jgi:hypothetical protein
VTVGIGLRFTLVDTVPRTIGRRRIEASEARAHELQNAAAEFVGPAGVCDRGLFRFATFEEADQWLTDQKVQRALARRHQATSPK